MTTETLAKQAPPARSPSLPDQTDSSPKPINYETGYLPQPIEYPDSDGQPMAESDFQFEPLAYAVESLKRHFQDRADVYVAGNIFFYFEEGRPSKVVAPDVLVIIGAEKRKRHSIKLWEEPKAPDFVLEITSHSTRSTDQGSKKGTYEFLGVTEYFCYDPTGDYLKPPLIGYRLKDGLYVPIPPKERTDSLVVMTSESLGLELRAEGRDFRFVNPQSAKVLRNLAESEAAFLQSETGRLQAEAARTQAESGRLQAEARIRDLEAQLAALKSGSSR